MQKLLDKTGRIIENDPWTLLPKDFSEAVDSTDHLLLPLSYWQGIEAGSQSSEAPGIWFDSDEEPESVAEYINIWACIGIHFPSFMDGRGFTLARFIREHYNYQGEIRAIGHIIPDQLFFLARCGFDTFALESPGDEFDPKPYFNNFSISYQTCADQAQPQFRRRS